MKLQTTLLGKTYSFKDIKDVLAKANEEKTGDKLAGLAAESAQERVAAKVVLSALLLSDLREDPAVPYEQDEVTRIIQDDVNDAVYNRIRNWTDLERKYVGGGYPPPEPWSDLRNGGGGLQAHEQFRPHLRSK